MSTVDERQCLLRAARGDRAAFDALVGSTAPSVWTLVRRLTVDERVAEDAMQETYIAAWTSAHTYGGESSARSWLYGVARRQAARTWRRRAGEPQNTESLEQLGAQAGWGDDPERAASRAEDRASLLAALCTLSESDQQVLTRCDLEGMTPSDLAAELDIDAGTVRVRRHRARLRLMAALREVSDD